MLWRLSLLIQLTSSVGSYRERGPASGTASIATSENVSGWEQMHSVVVAKHGARMQHLHDSTFTVAEDFLAFLLV